MQIFSLSAHSGNQNFVAEQITVSQITVYMQTVALQATKTLVIYLTG